MKIKQNLSAWNVNEKKFPKGGKIGSKLKFLVRYAILAPSGYNSQPWKFRISGNELGVWADLERGRNSSDPEHRELFISVGCAITNLEIAAKYFGMSYKLFYFPHQENKDLVAIFSFEGEKKSEGEVLFRAIKKRQTNRNGYEDKLIAKEKLTELEKMINISGVRLNLASKPGVKNALAKLIGESIKIWHQDNELVKELKSWFGLDSKGEQVKAEKERNLAIEAPTIAVLASEKDDRLAWVKTGIVYEILALKMVSLGIQNAFFNAVIQLPGQRRKLQSLLGVKGFPQLIFRLGYAKDGAHTPRRLLGLVIENLSLSFRSF